MIRLNGQIRFFKATSFHMKRFLLSILIISILPTILSAQNTDTVLGDHLIPFETITEFDSLFEEIDGQRLVLMGEATHGTSEFYNWRAELSKYLITEKGYNFIAVEGDWPAFSRINAYVKQKPGAPETIEDAMDFLDRWPYWMWRNNEVKELIQWIYDFNSNLEPEERVGFYGIDLYAKQQAMEDVISWFENIDGDQSERVSRMYACLSRFSEVRDYLMRVNQTGDDCSVEMEEVLEKVQAQGDDPEIAQTWDFFNAEQNAKLVVNAERHYRANLEQSPAAWNHRAGHFQLTASRLVDYYGEQSKGIVWAHNTHIGDARATDMGRQGMENIGQLSREEWGNEQVYAIGFGTHRGEVYAARQWEGQRENMEIPPAISGSWEDMLNQAGHDQAYLLFSSGDLQEALNRNIPHRAIGVTYQPEQESRGNYVNTVLPERYNAFIYIRETTVLHALD